MAALKAWLRSEGMWLYAGHMGSEIMSHVFLDGGKASVPMDRMDEFFGEYGKCLASGDIPCAVERLAAAASGEFRMFMDVDLKNFQGDLRETADQILQALPTKLDVGSIVVCRRQGTTMDDKDGLHVIWEEILVTSEQALKLLSVTVSNLIALFPSSLVDWVAVMDGSVYKNSGLRMLFSAKGKNDSSTYVPWFVSEGSNNLTGRTSRTADGTDVTWLKRCSIIPSPASTTTMSRISEGDKGERAQRAKGKRERDRDIHDVQDVHDALDEVLEDTAYAGCKHSKIVRMSAECFIVCLESKFCYNIGIEHKSNNAYLIVTPVNVKHACHDAHCTTHRKLLAGRGNALSVHFFGRAALQRVIHVLPSHRSTNLDRFTAMLQRQKSSRE
ncbi:hypothetical protein TSOC_014752 [Tetrabaena socialis]|uniref:C962R-like N-terminal AEP domain-containing protein n=1 Tax=Tetrabaena socialis TaxID=47790 RepID=A0A2J7ZGS7_9CHLO|nr:hypothetical protein TSOC_014752 [Tetrabaena socialis]|eukprot:PNG99468.1 hypothetical protein TSOC_014752 [Tetrabaena socialis]